jgi:bla regulator protein blaR1
MSIIEQIWHPVINATAWTLLHALWQLTIIALLWRVSMQLAKNYSPALRYNLSLLALLAIPAVVIFTFIRQYNIYSEAALIASIEFDEMLVPSAVSGKTLFIVQKDYPAFLAGFEAFTPYVFWIYLSGLIILSLRSIGGYLQIYSLRRTGIKSLPSSWENRMDEIYNKIGGKFRAKVMQSTRVTIPIVTGFFKPLVLLPVSMLTFLTPAQVEAIILHELYHIKRYDHYINTLQNFIEIIFFFHPATWLISLSIRNEREKCVDEWVVKHTGRPLEYARALFTLEENRTTALQPAVAASSSKSLLLNRIKNIMTMKTKSFNAGQKFAALAIIVAAAISTAWLNPSQSVNYGQPHDESWLASNFQPGQTTQQSATAYHFPAPSTESAAAPSPERSSPKKIILQKGDTIYWEELSEEDRRRMQEAMTEVRLAMEEVQRELRETFQSEEFQMEMQQAREEVSRAMQEMRETFQSEEFRNDMRKAGEEVRKALEEVELKIQNFDREEFSRQMNETMIEVEKSLQEVIREVQSPEFRQSMREMGEEIRKAMEELGKKLEEE